MCVANDQNRTKATKVIQEKTPNVDGNTDRLITVRGSRILDVSIAHFKRRIRLQEQRTSGRRAK